MTRALFVALVLGAVALSLVGMRRGWLARARRQAELPAPPAVPVAGDPHAGVLAGPFPGRYLATTFDGDPLDRVVVHELGVRARCAVTVRDDGVLLEREGARDLFLPRDGLGVRLDRGIAGSAYEEGGVLVLLWRLGGRDLATGLRLPSADDTSAVVDAVLQAVGGSAA